MEPVSPALAGRFFTIESFSHPHFLIMIHIEEHAYQAHRACD